MGLTSSQKAEFELLQEEFGNEPKQRKLTDSENLELQLLQEEFGEAKSIDPNLPEQPIDRGRQAEAALQGFGQGATLGYMPQLQAGAQQAVQALEPAQDDLSALANTPFQGMSQEQVAQTFAQMPNDQKTQLQQQLSPAQIDIVLNASGFQVPEKETYVESRDRFAGQGQQLEKEFPLTSLGSQVGGAVVTGLATAGLGGGTAATGFGKIAQAGKIGMLTGFLRNPGDTEGVVDPVDIKGRLLNSAIDTVVSAGFGTGIEGTKWAVKTIRSMPGTLKNISEIKAFEATGAMWGSIKKAFEKKSLNRIGKTLLDDKIVAVGDSVSSVAKKITIQLEHYGNQLDEIYTNADEALLQITKLNPRLRAIERATRLDGHKIAKQFRGTLENIKKLAGGPEARQEIEKHLKTLSNLERNASMSEVRAFRQSLDRNVINWKQSPAQMPLAKRELVRLRNRLNDALEHRAAFANNLDKSVKSKELSSLNQKVSDYLVARDASINELAKQNTQAAVGLKDIGSTGIKTGFAYAVGGLPLAAGYTIAKPILRKYGKAGTAVAARAAAKVLAKNPLKFGKISQRLIDAMSESPKAYILAINALKGTPEFKQALGNTEGKPKRKQVINAKPINIYGKSSIFDRSK